MKPLTSFTTMSDRELLDAANGLAKNERRATAELIAALAELDARRLYLGAGCSSLFTYCVQILRLSEHAAYGRIEAARAARRYPAILSALADGLLTLTAITLLAPVLTDENHQRVLESARRKSKREVEQVVAALRPRPDVPSIVRRLPQPITETASVCSFEVQQTTPSIVEGPEVPAGAASLRAIVAPLAPARFKIQLTVSRDTHDRLRRVQDLLRHSIPDGDVARVFERVLVIAEQHVVRQKAAATNAPRPTRIRSHGRTVPAAVRRAVWARDGGCCAFLGSEGRCLETSFLEFHHVVPYSDGGVATVENIQLRCRAHNQYEADLIFASGALFARDGDVPYCAVQS